MKINLIALLISSFIIYSTGNLSEIRVNADEVEMTDETDYAYSYTYNGVTYYSNESEDDAWYQAMEYNYEQGNLTEEDIVDLYEEFSKRNTSSSANTFDNQSDLTGSPVTYVNGYLHWTTSTGQVLPLNNIKVELFDADLIGEDRIAYTYTDDEGYYCFEFENEDGFFDFENGGYDVYIKCSTTSRTFSISRQSWLFNTLKSYYITSDVVNNITSGTTTDLNITLDYDDSDLTTCAFYVSQGMDIAQRYAIDMGFETSELLTVIFPFKDSVSKTAFCYQEYSGILKSDYLNFDTLMHEYGHFVECQLNTYGNTLMDIILYNPTHTLDADHFYDKNNKEFAMDLTWSEAWATVFSQIAQQYLYSEFVGKVSGFGDKAHNGANCENISVTSNSCEAQENAVIGLLWDIFDTGNLESFDTLSLSYQNWWNMTTLNSAQNLTDFINAMDTYYPSYRNQIAKIMEYHHISPSNLTVSNYSSVDENTPPTFSWKVNGSMHNPNNSFKLMFYNSFGNLIYQTGTITSTKAYNEYYNYSLTQSVWNSILNNFSDSVSLNVLVCGYNSSTPSSGPYYSQTISINFDLEVETHTCSFTHRYISISTTQHRAICECGNYRLQGHIVASGSNKCIICGGTADMGFIQMDLNNTMVEMVTSNGSFILKNGIIVLVEEDVKKYFSGELVFYIPEYDII